MRHCLLSSAGRLGVALACLLATGPAYVLLPLSPAHAASFSVTSLADGGAGSLRQAILDAQASPGADTISFSVGGTITLASPLPAITSAGGNLVIDGAGYSVTISGADAHRPFEFGAGVTVHLVGLQVRDGLAGNGGGIFSAANLTRTDTNVNESIATNAGGGIYQTGGSLTLVRSTVRANEVIDSAGAAALTGGGISATGGANVSLGPNSFVSSNHVTASLATSDSQGGGIHLTSGTLTLQGAYVHGNSATKLTGDRQSEGGGIFSNGPVTSIEASIQENSAGTVFSVGGGIAAFGGLTMTGTTVAGNIAREGGGVFNTGPTASTIKTSGILNNIGDGGGGILNTGTLTLANSVLNGNTGQLGSGLINDGSLTLTNATLSQNSASMAGGGLASFGPATLRNTILSDNTAPSGPDCAGAPTLTGPNLIENPTGCFSSGTPPLTGDPSLAPLGNYGGPTPPGHCCPAARR